MGQAASSRGCNQGSARARRRPPSRGGPAWTFTGSDPATDRSARPAAALADPRCLSLRARSPGRPREAMESATQRARRMEHDQAFGSRAYRFPAALSGRRRAVSALALCLVGASGPEQDKPSGVLVEVGRADYLRYCASCHGVDAHGKGPVAETLRTPPRTSPESRNATAASSPPERSQPSSTVEPGCRPRDARDAGLGKDPWREDRRGDHRGRSRARSNRRPRRVLDVDPRVSTPQRAAIPPKSMGRGLRPRAPHRRPT